MLHITSGIADAGMIFAAGIPGEILTWGDVVRGDLESACFSLEELGEMRARRLLRRGRGARRFAAVLTRDRASSRSRPSREVVLWFGHRVTDEIQRAQLLSWFTDRQMYGISLTMVPRVACRGRPTPEQTFARFVRRAPVSDAQLRLGRAAWRAFQSPDPAAITALLDGDTSALPWTAVALRRHLQEFPSVLGGLSRTERQVLEALAEGPSTSTDLFIAQYRGKDALTFGQATLTACLHDLASDPHPLLRVAPAASRFEMEVEMTDAGHAVLDGREDRVRLCGIDRWLGGVHLEGHTVRWRWSPDEHGLVASEA